VRFNETLLKSIDVSLAELLGETVRTAVYNQLAQRYDITRDESHIALILHTQPSTKYSGSGVPERLSAKLPQH